jgi:hypothetical protein
MTPTRLLIIAMVAGVFGQPPPLPDMFLEQPCDHFDATQWNCTFMQKYVGKQARKRDRHTTACILCTHCMQRLQTLSHDHLFVLTRECVLGQAQATLHTYVLSACPVALMRAARAM